MCKTLEIIYIRTWLFGAAREPAFPLLFQGWDTPPRSRLQLKGFVSTRRGRSRVSRYARTRTHNKADVPVQSEEVNNPWRNNSRRGGGMQLALQDACLVSTATVTTVVHLHHVRTEVITKSFLSSLQRSVDKWLWYYSAVRFHRNGSFPNPSFHLVISGIPPWCERFINPGM